METCDRKAQLADVVRIFLVLIMSVAAVGTVLTHIAQISRMPFYLYAITGVFLTVAAAGLVLWRELSKGIFKAAAAHPWPLAALAGCSLLGVLICLVSHRFDYDDFYYVPNVVYYLEHPTEAMGFLIHFVDSGQEPFVSYHFGSFPFEYSQGIVAYITGCHFLTVYYFFAIGLFGGMIPLVWFYLISRFGFRSVAAIAGSFIICMCLLLMGEQHGSFGNFAFSRLFQGKAVMFSVGIPLFVGLTMDFFRWPSKRNWFYLFLSSVAMVGFSTSAAMMLPMLALVLAIASFFWYVPNVRSWLWRGFFYLCTLFYPVLYAGTFMLMSPELLNSDNPIYRHRLTTYLANVKNVLDGPVVIAFLTVGTILAVALLQKRQRRFLVAWLGLVFLLYLNPFVGPIVMNLTRKSVFWRLFYMLPFPLVLGLSIAAVAARLENKSSKWGRIAFVTITVLLLTAHLPASSSSVFRRGPRVTRLGMPEYKVLNLREGLSVLEAAPPVGTMLALQKVSRSLPMLTSKYPQLLIRPHAIYIWMDQLGTMDKAVRRIQAQSFLEGRMSRENLDSLVRVIRENPQLRSIVADSRVAQAGNRYLFGLLKKFGFSEHLPADGMVVFVRPAG
ncbi:MAG: DUF6077 domain-containing protein [Planctomycetota bacterium]|jgi:MFS family permease